MTDDTTPQPGDDSMKAQRLGLMAGRAGCGRWVPRAYEGDETLTTWWLLGWDQAHIERNEGEPFGGTGGKS